VVQDLIWFDTVSSSSEDIHVVFSWRFDEKEPATMTHRASLDLTPCLHQSPRHQLPDGFEFGAEGPSGQEAWPGLD
jgi:hypothetical protein